MELILPIGFAVILLGIKKAVDNGDNLEAKIEPAVIRTQADTMRILSFSDYVTAILAKRECVLMKKSAEEKLEDQIIATYMGEEYVAGDDTYWVISGIPKEGKDWQVPFVKCDARFCNETVKDAYDFCNYPILAVAPSVEGDEGAKKRAEAFKVYIETRYPQLVNENKTVANFPRDYEFVQIFDSSQHIDDYVKAAEYGDFVEEKDGDKVEEKFYPQIGLAVVFEGGDDELEYKYAIRTNSSNYNSPELAARPSEPTTPDTKRLFSTYAKKDEECVGAGAPEQGEFETSCTGWYMYNGFLTTQRLVHDWIMNETGSVEEEFFVAEHGVRCKCLPCLHSSSRPLYGRRICAF